MNKKYIHISIINKEIEQRFPEFPLKIESFSVSNIYGGISLFIYNTDTGTTSTKFISHIPYSKDNEITKFIRDYILRNQIK